MLPATGLFRSINCPLFEKDLCNRPYCHFRHTKPEVTVTATYSATPKSLLSQSSSSDNLNADGPSKKKPKLEYIPMPAILGPKYTPSVKPDSTNGKDSSHKDSQEKSSESEKNEPAATIVTSDGDKSDTPGVINGHDEINNKKSEGNTHDSKAPVLIQPSDKASEQGKTSTDKNTHENSTGNIDTTKISKSDRHKNSSRNEKHAEQHKSKHDSVRKHSSSSHSSHKHSSSSKHSDRHRSKSSKEQNRDHDNSKSRSKNKESSGSKEKKPDRDKYSHKSSDKSRHKSTDKERHRSSHSVSKRTTEGIKSFDKDKKTEKKSSSSSRSHKSTSSATASTPLQGTSSKNKIELAEEIYRDLLDNPPSDIDVDSDDDEVMKQCKLIFEEYEPDEVVPDPKPSGTITKKKLEPKSSKNEVELIDMFAEKYYDENRKKRVAHDNITNSKPTKVVAAQPKKINHVQNAMKSVYLRAQQQQEELAARRRLEEEARTHIEEETRKAMSKPVTPRLSNGSPRSPVISPVSTTTPPTTEKSPVSPISTTSFYSKSPDATPTTSRGRFAPASNVLAFQKAKEKIEQLKKMKGIVTAAQTTSKGTSRVAHTGQAAPTPEKVKAPPAKPAPPVLEAESSKISFNLRMQYYNLMTTHCLNIYSNCDDAYDRAQTEELAVFKKCSTPMIYKSSALLTINKLRKEAADTGGVSTERNKTISHDVILAGKMGQNISWSVNKKLKTDAKSNHSIDNASSTDAYKMIYECILTEQQLRDNGFPRGTDVPGKAKIYTPKPSRPPDENERYCSRCSKVYNLEIYDEPAVDTCNYHGKSTCYRRGFADNLHSCCQQPSGSPGCTYANYHVSHYIDYDNLTGFVKTIDPPKGYTPSKKDIFALDCEMCYTTQGLELTRITVVDINEKTVYDALVKPLNAIVDYNTRFSGITEQMLKSTTTTLHNVQAVLLSMFNAATILIGHSLESDFKALKLIHDVVVDTSVLYPHKMGPPKKRALKTLCIENLKKIIQENDAGHDSAEDSMVCIQLVKHYLRNRIL